MRDQFQSLEVAWRERVDLAVAERDLARAERDLLLLSVREQSEHPCRSVTAQQLEDRVALARIRLEKLKKRTQS